MSLRNRELLREGAALELTVRENEVTGMEELLGVMGKGTEALGLQ